MPSPKPLLLRSWPPALAELLVQQVEEPECEKKLRATTQTLGAIENEISRLVQTQYEEYPYPRWVRPAPARKAKTVEGYLRERFPMLPFHSLGTDGNTDILIAGCGTGQQPIETATQFAGTRILAIDLSRTSLGYARRKAAEFGLTNIEYAQADILQLESLDRRFDVIEASGVLHHLADPGKGWRILVSLLRPSGFMRLGFYSRLGRRQITAARRYISERGIGNGPDEIRRCRREILAGSRDGRFAGIVANPDFFSMSSCRDLLFHVQEHHFVLPEIGTFLAANGLVLIGFDVDPQVAGQYATRFPDDPMMVDLDHWHSFESENPDCFASMYQFWVQRTG